MSQSVSQPVRASAAPLAVSFSLSLATYLVPQHVYNRLPVLDGNRVDFVVRVPAHSLELQLLFDAGLDEERRDDRPGHGAHVAQDDLGRGLPVVHPAVFEAREIYGLIAHDLGRVEHSREGGREGVSE